MVDWREPMQAQMKVDQKEARQVLQLDYLLADNQDYKMVKWMEDLKVEKTEK